MSDSAVPIEPPTPGGRWREIALLAYLALVALVALALTVWTIRTESGASRDLNLPAIALFALLLFLSTSKNAHWLRIGPGGEVTPGWAFAFALVLLGSTSSAIIVMALTMAYSDIRGHQPPRRIIFNVAQVALSAALGGLVLHAFDADGVLAGASELSLTSAIAIVASGVTILVANAVLVCVVLSIHVGSNLGATLREGFGLSLTADGALMALAPIFVITVEFSLLLVPMLAVTAFLVNNSARQSLDRAHDARHDPLTKLYNRRAFAATVDEILDHPDGPSGVLLLIDLDGFKGINDRLGHKAGDALLVGLAERMRMVLPDQAIPARLGGDEFSVFLPGSVDEENTESLIHQWRTELSEPIDVDGCPLAVGMSVGVAFAPTHGTLLTDLLHCADMAMYQAKQHRTGVQISSPSDQTTNHARLGLLGELAGALVSNELHVRFRPQQRLADRSVDRVTARLEWHHPTFGVVPSADFMGPAEHTELVQPLTSLVIDQAARALVALNDPGLDVAIEVPSRALQDPTFSSEVIAVLTRVGLDPRRLELIVTEQVIESDIDQVRQTIDRLRDLGITFAIQILDTESSSFSTLCHSGVGRVVFGPDFVAKLTDDAPARLIAHAVVQVAHGLGIEVVADGVDVPSTRDALIGMSCDLAQGSLIASSMPLADLEAWLNAGTSASARPVLVS